MFNKTYFINKTLNDVTYFVKSVISTESLLDLLYKDLVIEMYK